MLRQISKSVLRRTTIQQFRNFHITRCILDAKVFDMPAMSPTMESGAIVEWKVKEGDHYNSGDALLDIETDKATISVDAIDDGVMAKILLPDGTKDIKVGTPIAFLAEDGDDLGTLEYPKLPEESAPAPKKETASAAPPPPPPPSPTPQQPKKSTPKPSTNSPKADQSQIFFPSVDRLLGENHISRQDALKHIPATGPNGRILMGDVLAYLGKIPAEENSTIAAYIEKTSHLDLSNIKLAESAPTTEVSADAKDTSSKSKVKEPVVISEVYPIDLEVSYSDLSKLKSTIQEAISKSEQEAYATNLNPVSDLDDPLFDDIIAPSRTADRFKIDYSLKMDDTDVESLDLKLTLNDKCFDSKDRASIFIGSFKTNLENNLKTFQ